MPKPARFMFSLVNPKVITIDDVEYTLHSVWLDDGRLMGGVVPAEGIELIHEREIPDAAIDATDYEYRGLKGAAGVRAYLKDKAMVARDEEM